jgi:agmatinase
MVTGGGVVDLHLRGRPGSLDGSVGERGDVTYERNALPGFAGIATFFRAPQADFPQLSAGLVAVMGAPHDSTLGSRQGTRYGPRGIREGSLETVAYIEAGPEKSVTRITSGTRLRLAPGTPMVDLGDLPVYPNDLGRTRESLRRGACLAALSGALPVMFGGDHYVTFPLFQGAAEGLAARGARRLGYIQFDNHLDLSDDNRIWGKHYHGSQARRISELDIVDPRNMVWIGASGYTPREQVDWLRSNGATLWTPADIHREGIGPVVQRALEIASHGTDKVYVSLDIDVVNGGASPGTGSVVADGLSPQELLQAMSMLAESGVVGALDVTEVAPPLDPSGRTVRIAASAALEFVSPKVYVREPHLVGRVGAGGRP